METYIRTLSGCFHACITSILTTHIVVLPDTELELRVITAMHVIFCQIESSRAEHLRTCTLFLMLQTVIQLKGYTARTESQDSFYYRLRIAISFLGCYSFTGITAA